MRFSEILGGMKRTIELSSESETILLELAKLLGASSGEDALRVIAEIVLAPDDPTQTSRARLKQIEAILGRFERRFKLIAIRSTPRVMGGDACIRNTRIPVWLLVEYKSQGLSDDELLRVYPGLTASDLSAAWAYFAAHSHEVMNQAAAHAEAS